MEATPSSREPPAMPSRSNSRTRRNVRWLTIATTAALAAAGLASGTTSPGTPAAASDTIACPPGFMPAGGEGVTAATNATEAALANALDSAAAGTTSGYCVNRKHPESVSDLMARAQQQSLAKLAPLTSAPAGALRAAIEERQAMLAAAAVPGAGGRWRALGTTPLISDDSRYDEVNGEGLGDLAGRIDSFDYDKAHGRLFASVGTGGVWMSKNLGNSWRSISNKLPTQFVGAVAWTRAGGGRVITAGGEPLMGGDTYAGLGAYWTDDMGKHWHHAKGIRDGLQTFQVAVDPATPRRVYVATSHGLFRSTDGGKTYKNVALPVGEGCAGKDGFGRCEFANFVTDVVVRKGGGTSDAKGHAVLAAVGFRAGSGATFPNGEVQAPGNGLYRSSTGRPGTFKRLDVSGDGSTPLGFTPENRIGRTELGAAVGPKQDHNILYAIVQDAVLFNDGIPVIDAPEDFTTGVGLPVPKNNTAFNGVYFSDDFGSSWTRLADDNEISNSPTTGSALIGTGQATFYAPGVQAWYDMWVQPDPTKQNADGVPTRLAFGLEEVWTNRTIQPQDETEATDQDSYHVAGPYYAGDSCLLLFNGLPSCPTTNAQGQKTTHPDQQEGLWIPDGNGGVNLLLGNDGGAYRRHLGPDGSLDNTGWGRGNQKGLHSLLLYDIAVARDGTLWYGLQDNGHAKMSPSGKQFMTYGGDAFYAAVDPRNSLYAWEEYTGGAMSVTTDGGLSWRDAAPSLTNANFSNPFVMDPTDPRHLLTAGQEVVETIYGAQTESSDSTAWKEVFDLGDGNVQSTVQTRGNANYVGFCSNCDFYPSGFKLFRSGIATNVGTQTTPKRMSSRGWHIAKAIGLPERYVTSIAIDPRNSRRIYVTLGGYANREWAPAGSYLDKNTKLGRGHVFVSNDAGGHFTNISGNLPNTEVTFVGLHGKQLVVGTDIGAFISSDRDGTRWSVLGGGSLPAVPVTAIRTFPGAKGLLIASTFGRGAYCYRFPNSGDARCGDLAHAAS
jgi:hypothetical protein